MMTATLPTIRKVSPQEGDTIVLRLAGPVSTDLARSLTDQMRLAFPNNKVIVLQQGMDIEVVNLRLSDLEAA